MKDDRGDIKRHILKIKQDKGSHSGSRSVHRKNDKTRGCRRKADRHSHHRRRRINNNELRKHNDGVEEPIMLGSTTCKQKRRSICGCCLGVPLNIIS